VQYLKLFGIFLFSTKYAFHIITEFYIIIKCRNYYTVNELLFKYRYNPGSNFAAQNSMRFEQMGAFGTGILFIDYDVKEVLRYKCIHLKDVILGQNHQGVVNQS
jgi:hypothetical protein